MLPRRGIILRQDLNSVQTGELLDERRKRLDLGHLKGSRDTAGTVGRHESRGVAEYMVRTTGPRPQLTVTVVSEKAGTVRQTIDIR